MRLSGKQVVLGVALAIVALNGCGENVGVSANATADLPMSPPAGVRDGLAASAPRADMKREAAEVAPLPALPARLDDTVNSRAMMIRTGTASIMVASVDTAIARITALAASLGGFVANTQVQAGDTQVRSATIEIKIPADRFQQATDRLTPLGKVESVNVTAEDVGEEFVDVGARMANSRRLEARLVQLLAQRTGKLEDVLDVERELARVREDIERSEGRLRYLRSRAAVSTLVLMVHEKAPIVSSNPDQNVIGDAFVRAWRNFVLFAAELIAALGWLVPVGLLVCVAVFVGRRVWRRPATATNSAPGSA